LTSEKKELVFKVGTLEIPYREVLICDGPEAGQIIKLPLNAWRYSVFVGDEGNWLATYSVTEDKPQALGFLECVEVYA
jgi:hypothetical protein